MTFGYNPGNCPIDCRHVGAALLIGASLLAAGASAAVSDSSVNWHVELVGSSRACATCEPIFELRATGQHDDSHTFYLPADGATAIDAIHAWWNRAVIVQSFADRFVHRLIVYALSDRTYKPPAWSGFLADELLVAEFSVSPDDRYVLFQPARAPGEPPDGRVFLWDLATRMPGAPMPRRKSCGPLEAPCPPNPDLHVQLFPRPPAPGAADAADPLPYPLRHAVWQMAPLDDPVIRSGPAELLAEMYGDRLAFVALDRREWLTLVVVPLDGADSTVDCYLPIVPYRRDPGRGGAPTREVRSVELGPNGVVVEMYGDAGVGTVHTVPFRGPSCRMEREHWREVHADIDPRNE